ncbi:GGDEF domain-containing protein, partial [Falsiroseomonas sp. HW251]|uniref:GGDEF domain-containing protein n=1 Tax=Falsiroseomonas sp. HW251 TaxID=3390998 RepID=UPI003D32274C
LGQALGSAGVALLDGAPAWRVAAASGAPGGLPGAADGPAALVPLAEGKALVAWRDTPADDDELALLAALGPSLSGLQEEAARQQALDQAARTDPLTGLLNRRGFAEALQDGRLHQPEGVLAYLDMDGLKRLNDRHGHQAGDGAIRAMAARLAGVGHPGALAARLGGDEFALWLPGLDQDTAWRLAAPLGAPAPLPGLPAAGETAVAASIGLAVASATDADDQLLSRADVAMYRRKTDRRAA